MYRIISVLLGLTLASCASAMPEQKACEGYEVIYPEGKICQPTATCRAGYHHFPFIEEEDFYCLKR